MSDLPDDGLGPIVNLLIKLTAAQKEIERLTAELNESERQTRAQLDRVLIRDMRIQRLTACETLNKIERLQARNEVLEAALIKLSYLGNGNTLGNSDGNVIAQNAIAAAQEDQT